MPLPHTIRLQNDASVQMPWELLCKCPPPSSPTCLSELCDRIPAKTPSIHISRRIKETTELLADIQSPQLPLGVKPDHTHLACSRQDVKK